MTHRWHYHSDQLDAATELVERFHYSGRMTGSVVIATAHEGGGLFGDFGPAVAACVFNAPPTRWAEDVAELTRLVRRDDAVIALSGFIGWTVRRVRLKGYDLLVSYADRAQEHHGGIYQAANWHYHGERLGSASLDADAPNKSADGFFIDGRFMPRRTCNDRFGTSSVPALIERFGADRCVPHYDEGKHLYWKPLDAAGRAKAGRLGLRVRPYPKPKRAGSIVTDAPVHQTGEGGSEPAPALPNTEAA